MSRHIRHFRHTTRRFAAQLAVGAVVAAGAVVGAGTAHADGPARIVAVHRIDDSTSTVDVYSPAMDRIIPNTVLHGGAGAPTLYLLNGIRGGIDGVGWRDNSDYEDFFAGRHVNVVTPIGGEFSNYTDWEYPDPVLGQPRWETYLTRELPAVMNGHLGASGRAGIAGLSMSAGPAVTLAVRNPWLYGAVGAFSGCPIASGVLGTAQMTAVTAAGGGNAFNMWGPPGDARWIEHDPYARAGELAGTAVYLASASGVPGPVDQVPPDFELQLAAGGGVVEAVADTCTAQFSHRLDEVGVAHVYHRLPQGAHTWALFEAELRDAWATIGPAIGA